jgi:GNAT superfamily N-acetyltransferase
VKITFSKNVPLEATMEFEACYPEQLRMDLFEKHDIFRAGWYPVWMFIDGHIAGEAYACRLSVLEDREGIPSYAFDDMQVADYALYCHSNTVLPEFQGKGLGRILKAYCLGYWSGEATKICGHARPGASVALNASFGVTFHTEHPNWYGTGETYRFYMLPLSG